VSRVPEVADNVQDDEGVSPGAAKRLREAMDRLLAGRPQRTDGRLIKDNLWKEADVSRATMNRAAHWPNGTPAPPPVTHSHRVRPARTTNTPPCEHDSRTRLASARNSTTNSTRPLPRSPPCITTTPCYVKNSTNAADSSPCKLTAERWFQSAAANRGGR
jgi:hypothetical protein